MRFVRRHVLRPRLALLVLALVAVVTAGVSLPGSSVAPDTAIAVADDGATYDRALRSDECALMGRNFVPQLGCARDRCAEGAVPWRKVPGAEACALPRQPRGFGYAATVGVRECRALHRKWVAAVNYCASEPDRSLVAVRDAAQCTPPESVYVILSEAEGRYDECLTPDRAEAMSQQAAAEGRTLASEVAREQRSADPGSAGVLLVGDSVGWRGSDELARLRPGLVVDAEPARRPTELRARLDAYRARHGQPTGLIVELGTNPAGGYGRRDLARAVHDLPAAVPVLLVAPYVETGTDPLVVSTWTERFGGWMRSVAAGRPHTCVADWPAYVRTHPGLLQDGTHPRHADEGDWAQWLTRQWARC